MEQEKQKTIRARYNESAAIYNSRYGAVQQEKFRISLTPATLKSLVDNLVLDIGCGTGLFGAYLRDMIPSGEITLVGIDISEEMLTQARASGFYQCVVADIETMPIRPGKVPIAVSFTAFQNLENWKDGVDAMFDALARGGLYLASMLKKSIESVEFFTYLKKFSRSFFPFDITQVEDLIVRGEKK